MRFAREGAQASKALIREVNRKVHELALGSGITDKQAVLNIAIAKEFEIKLDGLHAQAFDARNFSIRVRCWRCRITFGFSWLWSERGPSQVKTEEVRDLKGFGEKETQVPTWNSGCVQNTCCGGRVRDKKEMLMFYRSCNW